MIETIKYYLQLTTAIIVLVGVVVVTLYMGSLILMDVVSMPVDLSIVDPR